MLFNSYIFIVFFLPAVWIVHHAFDRHTISRKYGMLWLIIASLFYYGWWNPAFLWILIFSVCFNYALGRKLAVQSPAGINRKTLLISGIVVNLGLLIYYKYALFLFSNLNALFGSDLHLSGILLPLGISFFTFQQIAYLVDSWQGKTHEYDFYRYTLFVTFFPQLIAGPIVHHSEMMPQFRQERNSAKALEDLVVGITIFSIGLSKKVMVADTIAHYATPVFGAADHGYLPSFIESWSATLAYTLQLYFDFSGYSDMAIGVARMFGIKLPLNFHSPYKAKNIIDFWHRWHMTLSRFFRDYIYIPLGGNRRGTARRYVNIMLTMFFVGFWHGAGWNFILWGVLHGIYQLVCHWWMYIKKLLFQGVRGQTGGLLGQGITLVAVMVAWVFFRAETFKGAGRILFGMIGKNGVVLPEKYLSRWGNFGSWLEGNGIHFADTQYVQSLSPSLNLLLVMVAVLVLPNTQEIMARYRPALVFEAPRQPWQFKINPLSSLIAAILFVSAFVHLTQISEFLYFNF